MFPYPHQCVIKVLLFFFPLSRNLGTTILSRIDLALVHKLLLVRVVFAEAIFVSSLELFANNQIWYDLVFIKYE